MKAASTNSETITVALAAITGPENLRTLGGATAVAPANSEEVAAILRFAQENHFAVLSWGGGTKQGWGYPVAPAVILETRRLNVIREHTWQDMTCTVEAGCTWAALQSALAQHGQSVALDPLWPERATVGGIVATNDSGALRLRYGSLRDLVIGMTIVLADGTIASRSARRALPGLLRPLNRWASGSSSCSTSSSARCLSSSGARRRDSISISNSPLCRRFCTHKPICWSPWGVSKASR
jgi:hypothetical protein